MLSCMSWPAVTAENLCQAMVYYSTIIYITILLTMSRSTWKGPYAELYNLTPGQRVKSRSTMILPKDVGISVAVHNGNKYVTLRITPQMAGHKFGEFAQTRKKPIHKRKKR